MIYFVFYILFTKYMTLIKSISGIRGTIGGKIGNSLSPLDVVKFTLAFGTWLKNRNNNSSITIVVGRDARISGEMINALVVASLQSIGVTILYVGLATTPGVAMTVENENAQGAIILTASHNPKQWNALKLLNERGEFISGKDGEEVLEIAEEEGFEFVDVDSLGNILKKDTLHTHIQQILALSYINKEAIQKANFKIVVDPINSIGAIAVPALLEALGVMQIKLINSEMHGNFAHNPEPLPEHLHELSTEVLKQGAHLGIAVDPDVDRLAFICEDGEAFGEEYTLVTVADYVLSKNKGNTVSNLSSTRALQDVTEKAGMQYYASAVGEVNVVTKMKEVNAIIGGEGNGGIILPELHYGRDAMVGIALFLSQLAEYGNTVSMLRASYPNYVISKNKIELTEDINIDTLLQKIKEKYEKYPIDTTDGVKIILEKEWIHLRKSNTEPIIRIYAESESLIAANNLAQKIILDSKEIINEMVC